MKTLRNLGLATLVSIPLLGNPDNSLGQNKNYNYTNQNTYFRNNDCSELRTNYDPNLEKTNHMLPDISSYEYIPLAILTAIFTLVTGYILFNREDIKKVRKNPFELD